MFLTNCMVWMLWIWISLRRVGQECTWCQFRSSTTVPCRRESCCSSSGSTNCCLLQDRSKYGAWVLKYIRGRVSKQVTNGYKTENTLYSNLEKNISFSTYPPPTLIHLSTTLYQIVETRSIEVFWLLSQPRPKLRFNLFVMIKKLPSFSAQLWTALRDKHFSQ
jgi:hypothetical protein